MTYVDTRPMAYRMQCENEVLMHMSEHNVVPDHYKPHESLKAQTKSYKHKQRLVMYRIYEPPNHKPYPVILHHFLESHKVGQHYEPFEPCNEIWIDENINWDESTLPPSDNDGDGAFVESIFGSIVTSLMRKPSLTLYPERHNQ